MAKRNHKATAPVNNPTERPECGLADFGRREFEALLTVSQMTDYEATQNKLWGTRRRLAMSTLTRSKAQLLKGQSEPDHIDTLLFMVGEITEWKGHLAAHIELAETAVARLLAAASFTLCEPAAPAPK